MTIPAALPLALMAQTAGQIRAWRGMRLLGFLLLIVLVLAIVYLIKKIVTK
jgi:hypothetical protein